MLLCSGVNKVAGRVVWFLGWVVFLVVWLTVGGLVPVLWATGGMEVDSEPGAALGSIVASVMGAAVCELLGVAKVVTRVWVVGLVVGVLLVVIRDVVTRVLTVVCVVGGSELEVGAAV